MEAIFRIPVGGGRLVPTCPQECHHNFLLIGEELLKLKIYTWLVSTIVVAFFNIFGVFFFWPDHLLAKKMLVVPKAPSDLVELGAVSMAKLRSSRGLVWYFQEDKSITKG